ncbi:MAG: cysteine--tRNA ligase [Gammaproteobacteria bacterium]|nr:cysteine--tRNA ligase [Gammaproteobacteria bacterium]
MLYLHNTLTRKKELFEPLETGRVGMYVCGMTVYDLCHVGHARVMVVFDVLYRHLMASGYQVHYVRNITDVDDKIIERAGQNGEPVEALTERFIAEMNQDSDALNVLRPSLEPRATETIPEMIEVIQKLMDTGYAYQADNGDVFYSVAQFEEYGKLSGRKVEDLRAGERVAVDQHKRDPLDFVLWKSAKPDELKWPSPFGDGRPGWHTECSAMSMKLLGESFDIHGGGMDLQFPHHENEIAQSEAITKKPFARYWLHNGFVRVDDEKMSKSLGNFFTLREVLQQYSGEEIRYFILNSHYRSPLNYSQDQLDGSRAALRRLYTALRHRPGADTGAPLSEAHVNKFVAAMDDDLNTAEAMAVLFDVASTLNKEKNSQSAQSVSLAHTLRTLGERLGLLQGDPDTVLQGGPIEAGGLTAEQIDALVEERIQARANKDWARSDEIRDELAAAGIVLEDADGKTIWRRS